MMGSVLTFKRMRRRPLPFSRQAASRALVPTRPTLPPAMAWRKRPRAPAALSPQPAQSVTHVRNETHIHPARDATRETMHFASIRQHVVAAPALGRQAATSRIARLHERSRHVERVLHHVWRRHDPGHQSRSCETPQSPSSPATPTREHRHTIHFVTARRLPVAYRPIQARRGAVIAPASEMSTALSARPQAAPRAPSASLTRLPMQLPARHLPSTRPTSRRMTVGAAARDETSVPILPVASDFRLPRRVSPAERGVPSEVSLEWRKVTPKVVAQSSVPAPALPSGEQAFPGTASRPGRATPQSVPSSLTPHRNSVPTVDPALADRLVDDIIRRIERRQRIERERRGL
jgi:hypothetical protein